MNVDLIDFGRRLSSLRTERGLSQEKLAQELGYSKSAISFYELGKRTADIEFLAAAAKYFNVSYDYLLGKSGNKTTDVELKGICDYVGLSDKAIEFFHKIKLKGENDKNSADTTDALFDTINALFCSAESKSFLKFLTAYRHSSRTQVTMTIKDSSGELDKNPIVLNSSDKDFENIALLKILEFIKSLKLTHNKRQKNFFYYYYYYDNEQQEGDENNG